MILRVKKLGEIAQVQSGGTPSRSKSEYWSNGDIPWVKISDFNTKFIFKTDECITKAGLDNSSAKILLPGTILMTIFATIGEVAILNIHASTNQAIAGIKIFNEEEVNREYLYYFLKYKSMDLINSGRGVAQKNINLSMLRDVNVPLPPVKEQKRIAEILDKAQKLIDLKEKSLNTLMNLEESLFYQMFGDPRLNKNNWSLRTLKEVSEKFSDGPFGSNLKTEHYTTDGVRVIRLQNIGKGSFANENKSFISEEHFEKLKKHKCEPNDVLIATIGNPNLRACLLPEFITEAINKADCIQCRPDQRMVLPEYICSLLNTRAILDSVSNLIHGQTRSRISMGQLSKLEIVVPPIELQKKYRQAIKKIVIKQQKTKESLFELQNLFQSLLQRAFKGELTKQKVR